LITNTQPYSPSNVKGTKIYEMADLNKFLRSKDRITELLRHLSYKNTHDDRTDSYIENLNKSMKIIDSKLEEFHQNESRKKAV